MTLDQRIAELRAELKHTVLTRAERREALTELERAVADMDRELARSVTLLGAFEERREAA